MLLVKLTAFAMICLTATASTREFTDFDEDAVADPAKTDYNVNSDAYSIHGRDKRELGNTTCPTKTQNIKDLPKIKSQCIEPGQYMQTTCAPCPIGYYKNKKAPNKECAKCACNMGTPKEGATKCINLCKAGKKLLDANLTAKRVCVKCEKGTYQPIRSLNTTCISCPKNWVTENEGTINSNDCFLNCSAGWQPNAEMTDCMQCPEGHYKSKAGHDHCQVCPKNRTTLENGALMKNECIELCKAGEKLDANSTEKRVCVKCEKGTYQPIRSLNTTCIPCPKNWVTANEGTQNSNDCFLNCSAGWQSNAEMTDCIQCPEGHYKSKAGPHHCQVCPKNRTTLEDGALMKNECIGRCDVGKQYNNVSDKCEDCGPATFKPENSSRLRCRPCPDDLVPNKDWGATKCIVPLCPSCEPCGAVTQAVPPDTPTTECPELTCPYCPDCPDCPTCPLKPCPVCKTCPEIVCPTIPTTTKCPEVTCPTATPCPQVTTPTPTTCPEVKCPTITTCPTCPTRPETTQCPEVTCPTCPTETEPTPCPQVTCPIPTTCPEVTCPTTTPCPVCHQCPTTTLCPVVTCPSPTPCPEVTCPKTTACPKCVCPTSTPCPVVTSPAPTEPPPIQCNPPWQEFNDACLIYISTPLKWVDADKLCRVLGGHLAEVEGVEKNEFLVNLYNSRGDSTKRGPWIGIHHKGGYWEWNNSEKKALYMNWGKNEPNFGESGENCAHYVNHADKVWNDAVCDNSVHSLPSLCEITDPTAPSCPVDTMPTSPETPCPDGWCPFGGSCYLYVTTKLDWYQAETVCKTLGGYLAEVNGAEENQFLFSMFNTPDSTAYGPWIGAKFSGDRLLIWNNSTKEATYTSWNRGEPNWGQNGENCAHYYMLSGAGWNDVVCSGSVSIPSLCEMELTCKTSKEVTCPPPTESPPRHCYHPWHKFNDACLIYIPSPLIWNDADKLCGLLGGHLAEIEGPEKNEFLFNLYNTRGDSAKRGPWIGIHYAGGYWKWKHSGTKAIYMNWNINEPNFGESGENCAHYVHHATREWNDAVCGNTAHSLPSLCEITDPTASSCPGDANPASSDTKCPDGWCPFGGSCYLYVTTALDWYQSETLCKTLGGHLAEVDGEEENQFLFSLFNTPGSTAFGPWIGAKFSGHGRLIWSNSTTEAIYTAWNTGEPNWGQNGENCAHYYMLNGAGWNDVICSGHISVSSLCEMKQTG